MQLVAFLEAEQALEVRRGHGRGRGNFYWMLQEEDGEPVPTRTTKKVKSTTPRHDETVKFPTPPVPEKVQSQTPNSAASFGNAAAKIVETKEREEKARPGAIAPDDKAERF